MAAGVLSVEERRIDSDVTRWLVQLRRTNQSQIDDAKPNGMCASFEASDMADDIAQGHSGQRVLSLISVLMVLMVGWVGFLIGSAAQPQAGAVGVWIFTFRPTPVSMAVYGMAVTTMVFFGLYLLVKIISEFDRYIE